MQAMTFMAPPQPLQVSMSILKTRLSRCAHVIDARRCAGVAGSSATLTLLPLPRFAGVTNARCRLLGANTPWKRVRLTLGFGTRAASLAMKSNGSKMTCVVPSRYGVLIDRNLNPQKTKKAPQNGCFFNTPCAPYERKRLLNRMTLIDTGYEWRFFAPFPVKWTQLPLCGSQPHTCCRASRSCIRTSSASR